MVRKTNNCAAITTFKLVSNADESAKIFRIQSSKILDIFEKLMKEVKDSKIHWIDDEGDRIPIETSNDLKEAIRYSGRVVKIYEGEKKKQSEKSKDVAGDGNDERETILLTDESITSESSESSESSDSEDSSDDEEENRGLRRRRHHGGRHGRRHGEHWGKHGKHHGGRGGDHGRRGRFDVLVDFPGRHGGHGHRGGHHGNRGEFRGRSDVHFDRHFGGHHEHFGGGHFERLRRHNDSRGEPHMPPNFYFDRQFGRHHGRGFQSHHHWPSTLDNSQFMRRRPGPHPCDIRYPKRFDFCRDRDRREEPFPQHHHLRQRLHSC